MHLLFSGVDAVLGPANITKDDQIPIEQCISTCKLRPGSGCLGVRILADGPTRVLQITDCLQQARTHNASTYVALYYFLRSHQKISVQLATNKNAAHLVKRNEPDMTSFALYLKRF